jgi:hypothetical protein
MKDMLTNRRKFLGGAISAWIAARAMPIPISEALEASAFAPDVRPIEGEEFLPRIVVLARKLGSDVWERVAETPYKHGDYVTASFAATETIAMEFSAQIELPGFPDYPIISPDANGKRTRTFHLQPGETVTADAGLLRARPLSADTE